MAFQDWDYIDPIEFHWRKGTAVPSSINFTLKIRDIIGEPEAEGYSDFEFSVFGQSQPWVNFGGDYQPNTYYPIISTGLSGNVIISLTSYINTFTPSQKYQSYIVRVTGKTPTDIANGTRTIISSKFLNVYLHIYEQTQPILLPNKISFTHYDQTIVPAYQQMNVDAISDWTIFLPGYADRFDVNSLSGNTQVEIYDFYGTNFKKITGNGSGAFEIRPSQVYLDSLTVGSYSEIISTGNDPNFYNRNSEIQIQILAAVDIIVNPPELNFHAIKTVSEALPQIVNIQSMYDFALEYPAWVVPSSVNGLAGSNDITFIVATSDTLDADTYTSNIKVIYNNGNGAQEFLIPITYVVDGFIVLPYSTTGFNFTLDKKFISFYSDLENTFFDMLMNIKVFSFFDGIESNFVIPLKIVLLRNRQRENIGLKIHRVMSSMLDLNLSQAQMYKTCEVDITVEEKDIDTKEIQREFTLEKIKFIAGKSPSVIKQGMSILSLYDGPTRIVLNSSQIVNLLLNPGNYEVQILINNQNESSYFVNAGDYNVIMQQIDFSSLPLKVGDKVEFRLYVTPEEYVSKLFYVFPDNVENKRLIWEDEYKLLSSIQCTGDYKVTTDFNIRTFKKYEDLVEILENIQTEKEVKLTINSGFLLKSEHISIESLCRAKRAWLVFDTEIIELVPQIKSMNNIENNRELYSYNLEFIINRKSDEEVYTF